LAAAVLADLVAVLVAALDVTTAAADGDGFIGHYCRRRFCDWN
jgi:hypothetical protein